MKIILLLLLSSIALLSFHPSATDIESSSIELNSLANTAKASTPCAVSGFPFKLKSTESIECDSASLQAVPQFDAGSKLELGIPSRVPMFALTTPLSLTTVWLSKPNASYDEHQLDVDRLLILRLRPRWTVALASSLGHSPDSLRTLRIRLQV